MPARMMSGKKTKSLTRPWAGLEGGRSLHVRYKSSWKLWRSSCRRGGRTPAMFSRAWIAQSGQRWKLSRS